MNFKQRNQNRRTASLLHTHVTSGKSKLIRRFLTESGLTCVEVKFKPKPPVPYNLGLLLDFDDLDTASGVVLEEALRLDRKRNEQKAT